MKFDYIIENPPYKGTLHLEFLKESLKMLDEKGKFTIIEPATWLINIRKNGNAKLYDEIKKRVKGHVRKIVLENYNKAFGISLYTPCSITYIDKGKTFDEIEFVNCGSEEKVSDIYDCNLIGDYKLIQSIISKCKSYGDMMKDHIYKEGKTKTDENTYYIRYLAYSLDGIGSRYGQLATAFYKTESSSAITIHKCGQFFDAYMQGVCFNDKCNVQNTIPLGIKRGIPVDCLYGTKDELENWKYFVFNNKLPLFLNICLIIDQNNTSKGFIPWITNKKYTDDEINELFMFTPDEIAFMDKTLKKFERHSPWFKRYMCGKDSVTSEEVQKFIDSL